MASVDLRAAYYSIPIASEDRKFFMFEWQGSYFQFNCLPNGLSCAPWIFTKILKLVYAHLRVLGHTCMGQSSTTHYSLIRFTMIVQTISLTQFTYSLNSASLCTRRNQF